MRWFRESFPAVSPALRRPEQIRFAWGNYQIGGGQANQSASYLDGAPLNTVYGNLTSLVPTQDAIQEFRVQTNNLGPEFGHLAGGAINLTTKSGSNSFTAARTSFFATAR